MKSKRAVKMFRLATNSQERIEDLQVIEDQWLRWKSVRQMRPDISNTSKQETLRPAIVIYCYNYFSIGE
ncbi:hypothetical protein FGO68_gene646 [Halteria grandinella]|uniref:Uncharacterized protein n=1 Tax=Halteria grandinella TaxID=5974 RepID=A0A8J8NLT3_HALGN|nr:hypothetical protein FGO68_gene646 [Halteria grandinella]